ncbi:SDR family oxidoreductase [Pseudomonas sp. JG-B]|nr:MULTISPECIES: SDR family oxidoreductase [unclassified Pseudomonas]MDH4654415.1 SDR family oxidoreductase [Pseudomonas sp. BN606]MRK21203.1 SDR family oxidoreductase [Pseudomonas sp. JG-B]
MQPPGIGGRFPCAVPIEDSQERQPMKMLEGKVALVTGGGQGVGQGIALALAAEGARVAVAGRTIAALEQTCAQIAQRGGTGLAVTCDVTDPADIERCVAQVVDAFGGLNILVNNAQIIPLGRILEVTDEDFSKGLDSGPMATVRLMRACYPHLKGDGAVVNLASSAAVRWDASGYGHYAATKEAIRALSRGAACEWGPDGIRVNVIAPLALSPGLRGWMDAYPDEAAAFVHSIPLGRVGDCENDIGRTVAFLVSDQARYLTGATIPLDGGHAHWG